MTSLQIAEVTGKRHCEVLRAIRNMESAWEKITLRKFASKLKITEIGNGALRETPYYELTKTECLYIATKFNDEARAKLILRWEQLEKERLLSQRPQQPKEAAPQLPLSLPVPGTASLVEAVAGKAVTTSRKLAQVLGRDHSSILDTIKNNQHRREFKYGHFTTRDYVSGLTGHGYEFLITRRGLDALASVMRYGAKDKIEQAYDGAWDTPKAVVPAGRDIPVACAEEVEYLTENTLRRIERLEQCVDNLAAMNKQAYDRVSMYDGLYQEEKEAKEKAERDKGVWYDLYADLMWRVVKGTDGTPEKRMERHQAFKDRLLKSIRRRIITE